MQKSGNGLRQGLAAMLRAIVALPAFIISIIDYYAVPQIRSQKSGHANQYWINTISVLSLLLTVLVAIVDYWAAPTASFTLFYLLIAAYAAWSGGRKAGVLVALAGSLASLVSELSRQPSHPSLNILGWNLCVQIAVSLFVVLLVSAFRNLTGHLEQRVKERTAALEHEIGERRQTEEQLRKTMQQLRQLAENIADAFWMRDAADARVVYVSPAFEKIWGRSCKELYQTPNGWLDTIFREDHESVAQAVLKKQAAGEYNEEYRIVRPDGSLRWIRDRAFPISDGTGQVIRIVGIAEDITDRRRLEREILEISDREQARLGQDLHDSLCQKLVSIAFDNNALEQNLAARAAPEVEAARQMAAILDDVITEARAMSRGLFPVQLESGGLVLALQQLAASVSSRFKVDCRVDCPQPMSVHDNAAATHLYRIAQEAANNAIKHGKVGSILIRLRNIENRLELRISDDGVGISGVRNPTGGMGLHIMNYRARTIGGVLHIERAPGGGTVVTCSIQQPDWIEYGNEQTTSVGIAKR